MVHYNFSNKVMNIMVYMGVVYSFVYNSFCQNWLLIILANLKSWNSSSVAIANNTFLNFYRQINFISLCFGDLDYVLIHYVSNRISRLRSNIGFRINSRTTLIISWSLDWDLWFFFPSVPFKRLSLGISSLLPLGRLSLLWLI